MNQRKIGEFLKQLRKEKGLTQEQLAEHFYVSSRSVSRWETGSNMPDVDMLIELADFYNVDSKPIDKSSNLYLDKAKERIAWYCEQLRVCDYEIVPDLTADDFLYAINDCKCNDHQREIALTLWGVYTGKPMTVSQLAKTKGVSYNAIRQIEKRFLQHILTNKNRDTLIKLK